MSFAGMRPHVGSMLPVLTVPPPFPLVSCVQGIDAFLSDPNLDPTAMYNRVKPLSDGVASLKLLLAATQANLAAAQPDLATLNSGLGALSQVVSPTLQGYSDKLTDLKDELALLTAAAGP